MGQVGKFGTGFKAPQICIQTTGSWIRSHGYFPDDFQILPSSDTTITVTSSWYFLRSPWGISSNSWKSIPATIKSGHTLIIAMIWAQQVNSNIALIIFLSYFNTHPRLGLQSANSPLTSNWHFKNKFSLQEPTNPIHIDMTTLQDSP